MGLSSQRHRPRPTWRRLAICLALLPLIAGLFITSGPKQEAEAVYGGSTVTWTDHTEVAQIIETGMFGLVSQQICGGSFLSDEWVLTAAHCVTDFDQCPNYWGVSQETDCYLRAENEGVVDLPWKTRAAKRLRVRGAHDPAAIEVDRVVVDPAFLRKVLVEKPGWQALWDCGRHCAKVKKFAWLEHDVALLHLKSPAVGVTPVKLLDDASALKRGLELTAYGWGDTDPKEKVTTASAQLKVSGDKSLQLYREPGSTDCIQEKSILCVVGNDTSGTGQGDSGGPWFMTTDSGQTIQMGVTSFGPLEGKASSTNADKIASIPAVMPWLRSQTGLSMGSGPTVDNVATALVIDNSGSMSSNDPNKLRRDAAAAYINTAAAGDYAGIVGFEDSAYDLATMQKLPDNAAALKTALTNGVKAGGGTNIGAGLSKACSMLGATSLPLRRAAILLTDGDGGYSNEADCYVSKGWRIYAVGLGSSVNSTLLTSIATKTGGTYQPVPAANELQCKFQQVRALVAGGQSTPCQSDIIKFQQTIRKIINVIPRLSQISFSTTWPGSDVEMTLISPSGRRITRETKAWDVTHSVAPTHEEYVVKVPEPGEWQVELYGLDIAPQGEEVIFGTAQVPLENQLPQVSGTATADAQARTYAFTADAKDPDGSITRVAWDFGDGLMATNAQTTHQYAEGGTYTPSVVAVDDKGETASYTLPPVTVTDARPAPVAAFTTSASGLTVSLNASGSSSNDGGGITEYAWDFDGDGTVDQVTTTPQTTYTYAKAGTYKVWLGVASANGRATTSQSAVVVQATSTVPAPSSNPSAKPSASPSATAKLESPAVRTSPLALKAPALIGKANIGVAVKLDSGVWRDAVSRSVRWLRDGQPVAYAGASYVPVATDLGHKLQAVIVAKSADGTTSEAVTAGVIVGKGKPVMAVKWQTKRGVLVGKVSVTGPAAMKASGKVVVREGKRKLAKVALKGGKAKITLNGLGRGKHRLVIRYLGDQSLVPIKASAKPKL